MSHVIDVVEVAKSRTRSHVLFVADYVIPNPKNRPLLPFPKEDHLLAKFVSPTKVMKRYV